MEIKEIMIVDDSESDQFFTKHIIKKFDPSIIAHQAYDGEEALEQLMAMDRQPCLILLDINMPRMNGFEFLKEYTKQEKQARTITMLTSSDQFEDKEKSTEYNCVKGYFVKPLGLEDLESILKS